MSDWILYGATGYTGQLTAGEAVRRGGRPILAGRDAAKISKLATKLGCPWRAFDLSDVARIAANLNGAAVVLNCAGPFSATAAPCMEACLRAGVHYLDITGEIDVIETAAGMNERAQRAGVTLLPAMGFDVVPSDCLAAMLAARLPGAARLTLAFTTASLNLSPGTAKTTAENLAKGGRVRVDGRITRVPLAWKTREIPFAEGARSAVTIPWGDVASAYYSTGIGNIEVYTTIPRQQLSQLRWLGWLIPLLRIKPLLRSLQRRIERDVRGPTAAERQASPMSLWGRVEDDAGQAAEATLLTPNGYDITVLTALAGVERLLAGGVAPGFHTPSQAFGREFILTFPGTEYWDRTRIGPESPPR